MPDVLAAITRGRAVMATVLIDHGTVTLDADQLDDATYDPTTMRAGNPDTPSTLWAGNLLVVDAGNPEQPVAPGTPIAVGQYRALLPYDAPVIPRGAVLTLDASQDPQLVGKPLYVHSADETSLLVTRSLNVSVERPR